MPQFVTINGRLHHYHFRQRSRDRAIVFVNSLGTDLRIWDEVIDRLPPDIPTLAYDKSGHGLSAGGVASIDAFTTDLAALMDALGIKDALVCGVSVGGMIAQALASARPDLVGGLVLCSTGYRIGTSENWEERIVTVNQQGIEAMAEGILERWFAPSFHLVYPEIVAGYRLMLTRTPTAGYSAVCAAIRDADLENVAQSIQCLTLCIAGTDDLATPPNVVEALASAICDAQSKLYTSVGHLPCIEVPSVLADDILKHLETLS